MWLQIYNFGKKPKNPQKLEAQDFKYPLNLPLDILILAQVGFWDSSRDTPEVELEVVSWKCLNTKTIFKGIGYHDQEEENDQKIFKIVSKTATAAIFFWK